MIHLFAVLGGCLVAAALSRGDAANSFRLLRRHLPQRGRHEESVCLAATREARGNLLPQSSRRSKLRTECQLPQEGAYNVVNSLSRGVGLQPNAATAPSGKEPRIKEVYSLSHPAAASCGRNASSLKRAPITKQDPVMQSRLRRGKLRSSGNYSLSRDTEVNFGCRDSSLERALTIRNSTPSVTAAPCHLPRRGGKGMALARPSKGRL